MGKQYGAAPPEERVRKGCGFDLLYIANRRLGGTVDALDFRILAELCTDPLATHEALGRSIERSASSVRKRIDTLEQQGVLRGFEAKPAAEPLGLKGTGAGWDAPVSLDDLFAVEGTIWAGDTIDGQTGAIGYAADTDAWIDAASQVATRRPVLVAPIDAYDGPTLGPLDLRVLRAMVEQPTARAEVLAQLCGLSAKTVRTRRATLLRTRAIRVEPIIRPDHTDAIAYYVYVQCDRSHLAAVLAALKEAVLFSSDGGVACIFCRASSLREKAERLAAARALGVEPIEVVQNQNSTLNKAAILSMIDARLAMWKDAGRRPAARGAARAQQDVGRSV